MSTIGIPKGTRDFTPGEMRRRQFIFKTISKHFTRCGFECIETPAMERSETLTGKYGEEGDRLIFKIMPRGAKLEKAEKKLSTADSSKPYSLNDAAEEALRYDLTVPFARFVVQHQNALNFPFKRYQIQPVWRADRPQKGRYREFYQCDADIIGSDSLMNETELMLLMNDVFNDLGLSDVAIKVNNRKILAGLADVLNESDKLIAITVALDKLDKLPVEKVNDELRENGVSEKAIKSLQPLMQVEGDNESRLRVLSQILKDNELGMKGIKELSFLFNLCAEFDIKNVAFEPTLARGLNYYTGAIFEVVHPDFPSSITGGGRYDDLTGMFGLKDMSGVGISFGADRIYDLMLSKNLFPAKAESGTDVLFINFGNPEAKTALKIARSLRKDGVHAEVYPDDSKIKKQLKYADKKNIPLVILMGEEELGSESVTVKNMANGKQELVKIESLSTYIQNHTQI